jgi:hypothetical protein
MIGTLTGNAQRRGMALSTTCEGRVIRLIFEAESRIWAQGADR